MPSEITKNNFCCKEHTIAYLRSPMNTSMSKGWHHTKEAKEKIRQANLNKDYNIIFTEETRQKLAEGARNKIWTKEAREKMRLSRLGKKHTEEEVQKIKDHAKYGWKNSSWKGRYAGYAAKHIWAEKHMKGPKVCVDCGATEGERRIQASNINHLYYKRQEDWKRRCVPCHRKYDIEHGITHPNGMQERFFAKSQFIQNEILGNEKKLIT